MQPRAKRLEGTDHAAKMVLFDHGGAPNEGLAHIWPAGDTAMTMLGELGPDDLATILYTSGSTGQSKGAWSDHRGVVSGIMNYVAQIAMAKLHAGQAGRGCQRAALRAGRRAAVPCDRAKCRCSCKASPSGASWC